MAPRKVIIDTDPGVDDVLAILLALASAPEELEILLISVTWGNIDRSNCLKNTVSMFWHIEKEIAWRQSQGNPSGFDALRRTKPIVAVGPESPLMDQQLMAAYYHGNDGLGGIRDSHPELNPSQTWEQLFDEPEGPKDPITADVGKDLTMRESLFIPSRAPGHLEVLRLLRENEPDSITIVAIGPLTNLALAAAEDPEAFLRAKEVVVMGGTIDGPGNVRQAPLTPVDTSHIEEPPYRLIKQAPGPTRDLLNLRNQVTPVAEFNTFADSVAAARVYALTSPNPHTTMPPPPPTPSGQVPDSAPPPYLSAYPASLSRRLSVTLFPLDITEKHLLRRSTYNQIISPYLDSHSPLAAFLSAFLTSTFHKVTSLSSRSPAEDDTVGLQLHDPLCIFYCIAQATSSLQNWDMTDEEDIRVETSGHWTRGMCVVDRRTRRMREDLETKAIPGDAGNWLSTVSGNRVRRAVRSGWEEEFGGWMLRRVMGEGVAMS